MVVISTDRLAMIMVQEESISIQNQRSPSCEIGIQRETVECNICRHNELFGESQSRALVYNIEKSHIWQTDFCFYT